MSIENPNKRNRDRKPQISRRDFMRIIGGAVGAYAMPSSAVAEKQESLNSTVLSESGEVIPSPENISEIFDSLFNEVSKRIGVENYTEVDKAQDDKGVYLWEVAFPIKDGSA